MKQHRLRAIQAKKQRNKLSLMNHGIYFFMPEFLGRFSRPAAELCDRINEGKKSIYFPYPCKSSFIQNKYKDQAAPPFLYFHTTIAGQLF